MITDPQKEPELSPDFQKKVHELIDTATPEQLEYIKSCMPVEAPEVEKEAEFSTEDMPED